LKDAKTISAALNPNCNLILMYDEHDINREPYVEFEAELQLIFMKDSSSNHMSDASILKFNKDECEKILGVIQEYLKITANRRIVKREQAQKKGRG
jgi:hypothetical protein